MKKSLIIFSLMIFLFSFIFINNVNAMTFDDGGTYPDLPEEYKDNDFIILKDASYTWLIILKDKLETTVHINGSYIQYNNSSYFLLYYIKNNAWVYQNSTNSIHNVNFTYLYSTVDIYKNDAIFFQKTPLAPVGLLATTMKMIAVETPQTATKVIIQMKTILLCGVGCLVLLISLLLLSKVFSRYRH